MPLNDDLERLGVAVEARFNERRLAQTGQIHCA
jgi:hypothetical protein